ncbi:hypothetical protein BGX29_002960 [Mortierella sp. GBA35]|nr:hypothetical protein BGX29_002960 [Mortierella sp. GBA35]
MAFFITESSPLNDFAMLMPILVGLLSAAYAALCQTLNTYRKNIILARERASAPKPTPPTIPKVSLRAGDLTHDAEYRENQDKFLARCRAEAGPVFKLSVHNLEVTVVSDEYIREMFLNENFSNVEALNELTGVKTFLHTLIKSGKNADSRIQNSIILEHITPNLAAFQPDMAGAIESMMAANFGDCSAGKLFENPTAILQQMVAKSTATVFMGNEVAQNPEVLDTFVMSMHEFAQVLGLDNTNMPFWRRWLNLKLNHFSNPLKSRVKVLAEAATPVVLERRARDERPHDILQKMLDRFDEYGFQDLEDICGHMMLLILTSVHTTIDAASAMTYYLGAYPETIDVLHREQVQVLDTIQQEREQERTYRMSKGLEIGAELDAAHDRDLSAAALKRMVYLDSFQREVLRCRTEALNHFHMAKKETVLSNGMVIPKYGFLMANLTSTHTGPSQGPNASEFQPWRFVGTHKTMTKVGTDFLTFGMGKHVCPGRFMAAQQTKTVVSMMVSKFSHIALQDSSKTPRILRARLGETPATGLIFTSRD